MTYPSDAISAGNADPCSPCKGDGREVRIRLRLSITGLNWSDAIGADPLLRTRLLISVPHGASRAFWTVSRAR
jgi:hypothetical protein